jgi:Tfp pilus assembly protein FimT
VTARFHSSRGFGLIENIVGTALLAMGVLVATPYAGTLIRRAEGVGAVNTIRATLASARLQAVKSGARRPRRRQELRQLDPADLVPRQGGPRRGLR